MAMNYIQNVNVLADRHKTFNVQHQMTCHIFLTTVCKPHHDKQILKLTLNLLNVLNIPPVHYNV